ncbi:unnamed protein product [Phytophthora fragariaefolia]|uniref:Unnamed protein product n=1 Tax=Phytophthora fragariaefolia TaxID=1490495 RepID=A0A9W6YAI1_9STRA|nr:unnamed protein product [Phytophthora fragariaefolia]
MTEQLGRVEHRQPAAVPEEQPINSETRRGKRRRPARDVEPEERDEAKTEDDDPPKKRRPRRRRTAKPVAVDDAIAGRTRTRVRRAPDLGEFCGDGEKNRVESPTRARAPACALAPGPNAHDSPTADRPDGEQQLRQSEGVVNRAEVRRPRTQQHAAEDNEARIYVFAGQGRRGTDSLVARRPRLSRIQPGQHVVECRRWRYRTRTGRYVLEFEVQCVNQHPDDRIGEKLWINQSDNEQLWQERRVRNEQAKDEDSDDAETPQRSEDGDGAAPALARLGSRPEDTAGTAARRTQQRATTRIGDDSILGEESKMVKPSWSPPQRRTMT